MLKTYMEGYQSKAGSHIHDFEPRWTATLEFSKSWSISYKNWSMVRDMFVIVEHRCCGIRWKWRGYRNGGICQKNAKDEPPDRKRRGRRMRRSRDLIREDMNVSDPVMPRILKRWKIYRIIFSKILMNNVSPFLTPFCIGILSLSLCSFIVAVFSISMSPEYFYNCWRFQSI